MGLEGLGLEAFGVSNVAVPDLVRSIFKATKLVKQDLGIPQLLRKRYNTFQTSSHLSHLP